MLQITDTFTVSFCPCRVNIFLVPFTTCLRLQSSINHFLLSVGQIVYKFYLKVECFNKILRLRYAGSLYAWTCIATEGTICRGSQGIGQSKKFSPCFLIIYVAVWVFISILYGHDD